MVRSDPGGLGETTRPLASSSLGRPRSVNALAEATGILEDDLGVVDTSRTACQLYETKHSSTVAIRASESVYERTIEMAVRRN